MFALLIFFLSVLALLLATYTDLKERIIPNTLTYSVGIIGLLLHLAYSVMLNDYSYFFVSVFALIFGFGFAYLLYKLGVWAGGDVKIFAGLAALNPVNYFFLGSFLGFTGAIFSPVSLPIFFVSLFAFSLFSVLPYAILVGAIGVASSKEMQEKIFSIFKKNWFLVFYKMVELSALVLGIQFVFDLIGVPVQVPVFGFPFPLKWVVGIALLFATGFIARNIQLVLTGMLALILIFFNGFSALTSIAFNAVVLFVVIESVFVLFKLMSLSKDVLREEKNVSELEEGDIPAATLYLAENRVFEAETLSIDRIIKYLNSNNLNGLMELISPKGEVISDSRSAAGLTEKQVEKIKMLAGQKLIPEKFRLKKSMPYAPAILIAYLLLSLVGDLLWHIIGL